MTVRDLLCGGLMLAVACFDSAALVSTSEGPSTSAADPSADTGALMTTTAAHGTTGGTPIDSESSAAADSSATSMPIDATSTGQGSTDVGVSSGESGSGSTSTTGAPLDTGATTAVCDPVTDDASSIGSDCAETGACPPGYVCQAFNGIVVQMSCQVLCEQNCECPDSYECLGISDKVNIWNQCTGPQRSVQRRVGAHRHGNRIGGW